MVDFRARNHPQQKVNPKVDDRATAPEVFAEFERRFGFTLDAAALPHNAKCRRFYAPPDFTARRCMWAQPGECGPFGCLGCEHGGDGGPAPLALDGLAQSWAGERVWCNPPYSSIEPWLEKAWGEDAELIVMLLPANRTEQGWWQRHVEPHRDRGGRLRVEFLPGRMRFIAHDDDAIRPNARPPFGVCLLIWDRP
jgi:hypothetical protein